MKIHKETIASELQLLIDGVNSKEQAVEEIAAYIRWRDKQLTIPVVVGRSEQLKPNGSYYTECECGNLVHAREKNCKKCGL